MQARHSGNAPKHQHLHLIPRAAAGGPAEPEDADVAVFRFTLGIPGFEDRLVPRVVGALGAALLGANHVLGPSVVPAAQVIQCEFV